MIFITGTADGVKERFPQHAIVHKPFDAAHIVAAVRLVTRQQPKAA